MARATLAWLVVVLMVQATWAAPAGDRPVVLYTSIPAEITTGLLAGFRARHPQVRVEFLRAGSAEIERRLYAEMETGGIRADLLWLADPPVYLVLRERGQLQVYRSPEARLIPAAWKDPAGYFTASRVLNEIIAVNTTLIPTQAAPRRWADFPRFGRTAAMPNPLFAGAAQSVVAALVREFGWGWFERARREGMQVLRSHADVARGLAAREFGAAMVFDYNIHRLIQDGAPLAIIWPEEGAISIPSPVAITRDARNVAGARVFIDYMLSREGQQAISAEGFVPIRDDVDPPRGLPRAGEVRTLQVPYEWAAANSSELRARFEAIMLR